MSKKSLVPRRPATVALWVMIASAGIAAVALEQPFRGYFTTDPPQVDYPSFPYEGSFTFARIKFRPMAWAPVPPGIYSWGLDLGWNHDYPAAEINFAKILDELTGVKAQLEGGNIIGLDDPRLFEHPWAYLCEVGFWNPTEEEAGNLRQYLLRGGFLVIDDFFDENTTRAWDNFNHQINRVLPGVRLYRLDVDHAIFRAFFELEDIDFWDPEIAQFRPAIYGIFEDNDPDKRLMAVVNYNMDIGDYWEWSDRLVYPMHLTEKGFKVGINYLMYSFLH
jgi:hypothetical protein